MMWKLIVLVFTFGPGGPEHHATPPTFSSQAECEFWGNKVQQRAKTVITDATGGYRLTPVIGYYCKEQVDA